ncbi:MAG: hypothetical protein Harvfovirus4_35 [Harvfovirus sp.]|uniref:Uncharacterized protein n=1 Tax=Harvfovirus sp. TaxID=2487768 RepID=A0A3G5A3B0_9VIRU|nr:MAG: hypothetical protein Harvfovirus4_35 [Harvfovirus sp.]
MTAEIVEEGTFQLLTQDPNKWISVVKLFNLLSADHPTKKFDKRDFLLRCELLNTRFKNVRKCLKNSICHLAFVTDDGQLVEGGSSANVFVDGAAYKALDKCEVIEYMINNSKYCSELSLSEFFDGTDTVVHILFRNGRIDLLKKLLGTFSVDFAVKNSDGQGLLEVINFSNQDSAMALVKMVHESQMNALRLSYIADINLVKQSNTSLLDINKKLASENVKMKIVMDKSSVFMFWFVLFAAAVVGLVVYS